MNLDAPNFNQYGGEFATPFDLTMTNPNGGGTIYYTLDGSDPRDAGGTISASATAYSGAIALTDSVQVRARVYDSSQSGTANDWSAEVDKTFTLDEPFSLRIVELMYNPAESGDLEYIELLNTGTSSIDLADVQITDFSSGGYTFSSQTLGAGERIVVPENVAAFQARYPSVTNVTSTAYSGSLSNGGETVTLLDAFDNVIQSFTYDNDGVGWPTTPDGGGPSLEYIGPLDAGEDPLAGAPADPFEVATNWQASAANGGSPGVDGTASNHDPVITSDGGGATADLYVPEGNTAVTTVTATDVDLPPQTLTFSITGGADSGHFGIGSSSGVLTFNSAPVYATPTDSDLDGVYIVEVTVDDGESGTDSQMISVTVTGANQDPVITSDGGGSVANLNIDENTTAVTTVTATDPDLPPQTLTYSLTGGADSGLFSIGSSSGVLTFDSAPDYENPSDSDTNNVYIVEVTVDDGFGGTDTQTINITVDDANDAPVITSDGGGIYATAYVAEESTAVTTVTATDQDVPAQTLTYSISGGTDASQFDINSSSGVLTFLAPNDYENPDDANSDGTYEVEVFVGDGNGGSDLQYINVVLTNENDAPVITSDGGGSIANLDVVDEQTAVTTVAANDVDIPADTLTYTITGGADAGHFGIVGSTGVLTFNSAPVYSNPTDANLDGTYVVEVTVDDGNGGSDSQMLNVTIVELPVGDPSNLRIVELHYNPTSSPLHEFIELVNAGFTSLSLDGVEIDLNAGAQNYAFESGQGLLPGERIVVVRNVAAFTSYYDPVANGIKVATGIGYDESPYDMSLSNTAETITLYAPGSVVLQQFYYEDGSPWPSAPDGSGPSMEYVGPLTLTEDPLNGSPSDPFDVATNWEASTEYGGTPGEGDAPLEDADFDDDTFVTGSDFLIWQRNVGRTTGVSNATGDANGDNQVNAADLAIWRLQFGTTVPVAAPMTSPMTLALSEPLEQQVAPQAVPAVSQVDVMAAALVALPNSDTTAVEAVFAEEAMPVAFDQPVAELSEIAVVAEQTAQDEALATLGEGEAEDEYSADVLFVLMEDELV